jgi:ubiquinone/menaquinone biosynthesis C-methylase UbiE
MRLRDLGDSPRVYDAIQMAAGARQVRDRLRPYVYGFTGMRVLDVGAGTGSYLAAIPDPAEYVAVDLDPAKLARLKVKWPHVTTVVGDATRLDFPRRSFDHALCTFLVHHLNDHEFTALTAGLRILLRKSLVLVDPLRAESGLRSRILWSIDRGSYPRSADELLSVLEEDFVICHAERFQVHHAYLLCVAKPRPVG